MLETIDTVCGELHNYFEEKRVIGDYTIEEGRLLLPFLVDGQYFRIVGSKFNDSVYVYHETPEEDDPVLTDETFHGGIWPMSLPKAFIDLCSEIKEYNASDAAKPSGFTSENISGFYSYTKGSVSDTDWQNVFKGKLSRFRKAANIWL